nr:uncharacterized protein LOC109414351 [Aedes albopictus]
MPPKKITNQQQSVKVLIDRINVLGENFRSRPKAVTAIKRPAPPDPPSPPKTVRFVEPTIPEPPRIVTDDPADNPYAQEIFMFKTNVHDVTTRIVLERDGEEGMDKKVRSFKRKLYRMFATEPKNRIRYPLDRVRFESPYYEYRFFLALHKPLHSDDEYQEYKRQLAAAGVTESWIQMRKNNRLLMYEDRIVHKLKSKFKEWSLKLDKLDVYLMDMHARQPGSSARKINEAPSETSIASRLTDTECEDNLLEQLLKHSNAKQRFTSHQIQKLFPHIQRSLQQSNDFQWLEFEDDELNKRYRLGSYAPNFTSQETVQEEELVDVAPLESAASTSNSSRPGSAASGDSEIAQMRSEMAMTQPRELTQLESSRFVDTQALVNVLEQQDPKVTVEMVPQRLDAVAVEELPVVTEELLPELSPMITPAQAEVIEVSDSPVREDDEVQIKEEFLYTLDYIRQFTNIEQYMSRELKQKFPKTYEKKLTKLNQYIERYYKSAEHLFLKNTLPPGLRLLSRKERKERQTKTDQQPNTSEVSPAVSEVPPPTTVPAEISPITDTPLVPRVPRKARLIVYEEDDDDVRPPAAPNVALLPETLPMPNSEDFLPPVCSTQIPGECLASPPRRRDTPFSSPSTTDNPISLPSTATASRQMPSLHNFTPSMSSIQHPTEPGDALPPNRQDTPTNSALRPPSSSSRVPTPAFDSSSLNATVIVNPKSPQKQPVSIKRELNSSSYEGEVEFVDVPRNSTILIEDSINESERFPGALLERQPSCMAAIPDNLRGMVSTLFRENQDTTLSQGSGASNGSGDAPVDSQMTRTSSMGFHQTLASTQNN